MNRRQSLKTLGIGTLSAGVLLEACKNETKTTAPVIDQSATADRQAGEVERDKKLNSEKFFTEHEMATITILADMIIPKDEHSGSASDAKVPDFIEFIVKDMPDNQVPMRGGLRWLDIQSFKKFEKPFKNCSAQQQLEMVDAIAYPEKAKPAMAQGVAFFNLMRNLTSTGFYTSEMGGKDINYMGNRPNQWNGVPEDVLKQYGLAYTEKEQKECVKFPS